jgi:hypothetical protein
VPVILVIFNEIWIFSTVFRKILAYFIKICPVETELVHMNGRTDRQYEANRRFSHFCWCASIKLWKPFVSQIHLTINNFPSNSDMISKIDTAQSKIILCSPQQNAYNSWIPAEQLWYTGKFISPSGISDLCGTAKLRQRIVGAVAAIDRQMLQSVWQELYYRIDICRVTKGGLIEHL